MMTRFFMSVFLAFPAAFPASGAEAMPFTFDFLLPAEGDVLHAPRTKVVIRVAGGVPDGLLAVLDGVWLEQPVRVEKDVLTFEVSDLKEGVHAVRLMYLDTNDRIRSTPTTRFFVRLPEPPPPPPPPKLKQFGRIAARMEWKNEEAASRVHSQAALRGLATVPETDSTYAYDTLLVGRPEKPLSRHGTATVEGSYTARYEQWEADVKASVSTHENRFRQPVNRFSAQVAYGPWMQLKAGDIYPEYNPLIFSGTRVRGAEAGAALVRGENDTRWVYARAVSGETQRSVPAYIIRSRLGGSYDTLYVPGTRAQRLAAFRIGTGGGDAFDVGVTLMKASAAREDSISEDVNEYLYGPAPSENLVSGLDGRIGFWDGKLELYGRGAMSLYTRDRSLGAFTTDTSDNGFDPVRYRRIIIINPTTNGWEYLAHDGETSPDYSGFLHATSAYNAGIGTSFPWKAVIWETDLSYSHLGAAYHTEGNLFLGANPGGGWNFQQRLGFWDNRIHTGVELIRFVQDFGDHEQLDHTVRAELRFTTLAAGSAAWLNAGVSRLSPRGYAEFRYEQDFDEINAGVSHQLTQDAGTWNLFMQYGFTRGDFRIVDPLPEDPTYPVSITHAVTTSVLYKFRESGFMPKITHSYADNGVQLPVQALGCGAQQSFLEKKLKVDANLQVNQFARTTTRNGTGFGQNASATFRFRPHESLRLSERASWQGRRVSIIAGSQYERHF